MDVAKSQAALVPMAGGEPAPVPGTEAHDVVTGWAEDSRHIFVVRVGVTPTRIDRLDVQTGERASLRELSVPDPAGVITFAGVRPSPNGRTVGFLVVRRLGDLCLVRGVS